MGLGMFETPLYLNLKCIVFGFFLIAIYFMPHFAKWQHEAVFAFVLAMAGYVFMAWYDTIYDCNDKFGPSFFALFVKWAKPEKNQKDYDNLPVKWKKTVRAVDIAVGLLLVGLVFYPYLK